MTDSMNATEPVALLQAAKTASENAYIPYSRYPVGAALRTRGGKVYTGCNIENASFPAGICAERTALVKAISEGERDFDVIAVYTDNGGSPCGVCRQMLYEFAPDLRVLLTDDGERVVFECTLSELLPRGFGPMSLPETPHYASDYRPRENHAEHD